MPTIAFFGATGNVAGYCLMNALNAGYECRALARTPAKLTKSLKEKQVDTKILDAHLTIIEGDVKNVEAVKRVLQLDDGTVVDTIVSGIGSTDLRWNWSFITPFVLGDPTICQDAGNTILRALQELQPTQKPLFVNVLTTGLKLRQGLPHDVPFAYIWLYHWLLKPMHDDKDVLQDKLAEHISLPTDLRVIRGYVNPKPTLLFDGEGKGASSVKAGTEEKPALGYAIKRMDVGAWIFENLVRNEPKKEWMNKGVSLAY